MLTSLLVTGIALAGVSNAVVPPFHLSRAAADLQSSLGTFRPSRFLTISEISVVSSRS